MAFPGVHHLVVRVKDLDASITSYNAILGFEPDLATSEQLKAKQAFYRFDNGTFVELIQPTDDSSPIAASLGKLGEGIHTVALAVDDRAETAKALDGAGVRTIGGTFVHPGSSHGVLLQLAEA
jgi:catechol 2,3-dioxygenase-like lactoylglutathione lyase family enzyme